MSRRLAQDGGVEGCALTPSCESTGITTNCWTIIDRKTRELTKKVTPHPKTKEKLQWDGRRGTITIQSNSITAGWVTHKLQNTYTTEVHPLEWMFWAPCQASKPGGLSMGGGTPRESDFEAWWDLIARLQQDWRNRDSTLGGHTKSSVCIGTQGKEQWPHRDWTRPTCLCWRVSCRGRGWLCLTVRTRTLTAEVLGSNPWREPSQSLPLPHQIAQVGSSVGFPQAKQPTGRGPSPTHQQTSWLKFYWALPTRATASSTHRQSLPSGDLHKPLR